MTRIGRRALLPFLLLGVDAASVKAQTESQQRLHVLRIQPAGLAGPADSVIVTFDRPVAPALDRSVDPTRVVRITPAAAHSAYWRDPSSLVVVFDRPWSYAATYRLDVAPTLRSADGRRIAERQGRAVQVRPVRAVAVWPTLRADLRPATMQRPRVLIEAALPLTTFAGKSWLVPFQCRSERDSIPLRPESIALLDSSDARKLAGREDANPALDSLRRVVQLVAERELPRDCQFGVSLQADGIGMNPRGFLTLFKTTPPFRLDSAYIPRQIGDASGHVALTFSAPITESEMRRTVRVNGHETKVAQSRFQDLSRPEQAGGRYTWTLADSLPPGGRAEVTVQRDLRDVDGEELGADVRRTVERPHATPAVSYPSGPVVVPRDAGVLFIAGYVNTDSIRIEISRVPDSARAAALHVNRMSYGEDWRRFQGETMTRTIAVASKLDSTGTLPIPASLLPDGWRDDPLLVVSASPVIGANYRVLTRLPLTGGGGWSSGRALLLRTNLAAHVTAYDGRAEVWVTRLRSAEPVPNARLRVVDQQGRGLADATTDARGRAHVDYRAARGPSATLLLEATSGADRVLVALEPLPLTQSVDDDEHVEWFSGEWPRDIGEGKQLHGAAFSERGIYRPGERVFLEGVVRTFEPNAGYATPAGDSARWTIQWMGDVAQYWWSRKTERMRRRSVILSPFGTAADTFDILRNAPLGLYHATLAMLTPYGWRTAAKAQFTVGEYRAVEFALGLDSDTTIALFAGDTARVRARARYLFGMPMTGAMVTWGGLGEERSPWGAAMRGLDGYHVGRSWWRLPTEQPLVWIARDSAMLDAAGTVAIAVPAATAWPTGAMHLVVTAVDANRQTVTAERTVTVHAADAYVGLRTRSSRWYWNAGDTIPVELLVARANGERRAGANVALTALRYEWRERVWHADTVWRGEVRSTSDPVRAPFVPPSAGWYELLATVRDERGRASASGLDLWVTGSRRVASAEPRDIQITLDRQRYAPGDVIEAVMDSPVEQRAWVSLSRSVPLNEQLVLLHAGPNVVRIPVPAEAMPRAEVRVVGVAPLGDSLSVRARYLATAVRQIEVSARSRELAVRVSSDRSRYSPREPVRVRVRVSDAAGRGTRAETTIWAVDEGVGLLTGLEKPDLLGTLLGKQILSPWQRSTLDGTVLGLSPDMWMGDRSVRVRIRGVSSANREISGSVPSMMLEEVVVTGYGAEHRAPGALLRSHFSTTPIFVAGVVTDSAGVAETSFILPDNVTTYRLFATAVSAGMQAGSGDTTLVTTRPLIVRAALPRAVRIGDSLVAGGVLTQDADGTTPVSLHVETRGIDVRGATTRTDTLHGRVARELRFPMRVASGDSVMVRLRGGSATDGDAVQLTLPVSPPGHARAHVVSGTMRGSADVALPVVEGIDVARSRATVQLGSSVLPLVRQLSDALRVYPYGCTEQLASAGRALLARLTLERVTNPAATLDATDRAALDGIVSRILSRQQGDGGIGYWERDGWTSPWLTAYATELLIDARAEGARVPTAVTDGVAEYLVRSIPDLAMISVWTNRTLEARSSHDLLATARVLRRLGRPDARLEDVLSAMRDRLPFVDRLELAQLRAMAGDSVAARRLLDGAWGDAHASGRKVALDDSTLGTGWLFESRLRPLAMLAKTTADLSPMHPLLGALVESLVQRGRAERGWQWNTLDQSATAEALAAARSIYGFGAARRVDVIGPRGTLATSRFEAGRADSIGLPLAALVPSTRRDSTPRIRLVADSVAPIYYAATLFETPRARPVRADDEGISVERWYEGYDDGKPLVSVREGQLVRVRLRVTVKGHREFVAVEDPLPAGLEAVDLNLRTSAALQPPEWARKQLAADARRARRASASLGWWSPWEHTEMRDDRVLYFARTLARGSWEISYVARATTAGVFVRPPAHVEEMYNPAVHGRSDGGWFTVTEATGR